MKRQHGRQTDAAQRTSPQVIVMPRNAAHLGAQVVRRFEYGKTVRELGREFDIPEREAEAHIREKLLTGSPPPALLRRAA